VNRDTLRHFVTHGDTLFWACVTLYFVCLWGFTPRVTQVTQIVHEYVYARVWGVCANGVTLCHVSLFWLERLDEHQPDEHWLMKEISNED